MASRKSGGKAAGKSGRKSSGKSAASRSRSAGKSKARAKSKSKSKTKSAPSRRSRPPPNAARRRRAAAAAAAARSSSSSAARRPAAENPRGSKSSRPRRLCRPPRRNRHQPVRGAKVGGRATSASAERSRTASTAARRDVQQRQAREQRVGNQLGRELPVRGRRFARGGRRRSRSRARLVQRRRRRHDFHRRRHRRDRRRRLRPGRCRPASAKPKPPAVRRIRQRPARCAGKNRGGRAANADAVGGSKQVRGGTTHDRSGVDDTVDRRRLRRPRPLPAQASTPTCDDAASQHHQRARGGVRCRRTTTTMTRPHAVGPTRPISTTCDDADDDPLTGACVRSEPGGAERAHGQEEQAAPTENPDQG